MFKVSFCTEDDAFAQDMRGEISTILEDIVENVEGGETSGNIRDSNGNHVGSWVLNKE